MRNELGRRRHTPTGLSEGRPPPDGQPLYRQVHARLEEMAVSLPLDGDGLLPPEPDLVARFGVSRGTLRRAVDELARAGLLRVEPGRGTYVDQATKVRWLVWERLRAVARPDARFDLDVSRFVPDFDGRERCDEAITSSAAFTGAATVFCAPDNSLTALRTAALAAGKRLVVPTFGLRRDLVRRRAAGALVTVACPKLGLGSADAAGTVRACREPAHDIIGRRVEVVVDIGVAHLCPSPEAGSAGAHGGGAGSTRALPGPLSAEQTDASLLGDGSERSVEGSAARQWTATSKAQSGSLRPVLARSSASRSGSSASVPVTSMPARRRSSRMAALPPACAPPTSTSARVRPRPNVERDVASRGMAVAVPWWASVGLRWAIKTLASGAITSASRPGAVRGGRGRTRRVGAAAWPSPRSGGRSDAAQPQRRRSHPCAARRWCCHPPVPAR